MWCRSYRDAPETPDGRCRWQIDRQGMEVVPSAAICPAAESGVSVPWTRGRWVPATSVLQAGFHPTTVLRVCPVVDRRILGKALGGPVTRHLQVSCQPVCLLWRGQLNNACAERDSVGFVVAVSLLQGSLPSIFNITQSCRLANAGRLDCVMDTPNGMAIRRHATKSSHRVVHGNGTP